MLLSGTQPPGFKSEVVTKISKTSDERREVMVWASLCYIVSWSQVRGMVKVSHWVIVSSL
jgi:hypothetical protein